MRVYFKDALNFWGLVYLKLANLGQCIIPLQLSSTVVLSECHTKTLLTGQCWWWINPNTNVLRVAVTRRPVTFSQPSSTFMWFVCNVYTCKINLIVKLNCLQNATPNLLSRSNFDVSVLLWWMNEFYVGPGPTELHVPCSRSMVDPQEVQIYCNTILKLW